MRRNLAIVKREKGLLMPNFSEMVHQADSGAAADFQAIRQNVMVAFDLPPRSFWRRIYVETTSIVASMHHIPCPAEVPNFSIDAYRKAEAASTEAQSRRQTDLDNLAYFI